MATKDSDATLYLAHATTTTTALGELVRFDKRRTHKGGIARFRIRSWGSSGPFKNCTAIRVSLRNAAGVTFTRSIEIKRGDTGWKTFTTLNEGSSNLPSVEFRVSMRARGACNYSTPGGYVYDPVGHQFTAPVAIEWRA